MSLFRFSARLTSILIGLTLTALVIAFQLSPHGTFGYEQLNKFDGIFYDLRLKATLQYRENFNDTKILIIDIDEKTMREQGRFPWSRFKTAELVDRLFEAGVIVIAFDVMFSEQEQNPIELIYQRHPDKLELQGMLNPLKDSVNADKHLAQSLTQGDVILGVLFEDQLVAMSGHLPDTVIRTDKEIDMSKLTAVSKPAFIGVIDELYQAAQAEDAAINQAFMNSTPDADGSIRRAALIIKHKDQLYGSLAFEAVRAYLLAEQATVLTATQGGYHNIVGVQLEESFIPTDINGSVLVPYRGGKRSFQYISATDVIEGRVDEAVLADSIVFVGTSAVGLADLRETPVGIQYPGVEVHANVAEGILHPEVLNYTPDITYELMVLYLFVFGVLASWIFPRLGPINMAITGTSLIFITVLFNLLVLVLWKIALPLTTPLLLIFLITTANVSIGFITERSQKRKIKGFFDQYVPPAHIDKMLSEPDSVTFDGERKVMSVLFSDIRSFTTISESLTASELKQLLNQYFSPITETILENKGTIDKYVGDMVMAFWGAPLDDADHATNSIAAAFDMLAITAKLREEFVAQGWPEIHVGIGINTGEMNVGDMGSEFRRAYTVLGDAVNLGSRLEGLTKFYGLEFLVSESTKDQAPGYAYRAIDKVKVKGKNEAVAIFEPIKRLVDLTADEKEQLDLHNQAYALYLEQRWDEASQVFSKLLNISSDKLLYQLYLDRIKELEALGYIEFWDGSYTHTSK